MQGILPVESLPHLQLSGVNTLSRDNRGHCHWPWIFLCICFGSLFYTRQASRSLSSSSLQRNSPESSSGSAEWRWEEDEDEDEEEAATDACCLLPAACCLLLVQANLNCTCRCCYKLKLCCKHTERTQAHAQQTPTLSRLHSVLRFTAKTKTSSTSIPSLRIHNFQPHRSLYAL